MAIYRKMLHLLENNKSMSTCQISSLKINLILNDFLLNKKTRRSIGVHDNFRKCIFWTFNKAERIPSLTNLSTKEKKKK